ncbi:MAG TPA: c-type cytochrome [Candidatus Limnocylindrales bacterium]|nr:c-type cytochrome [Candidatus Limnocylindrales bacterium]
MSEERTGRELARREEGRDVAPSAAGGLERFDAGPEAHVVGLTEERAAQIVRQSGNARSLSFLALLLIVLFIPIYWFYDIGIPTIQGSSRLDQEKQRQYVTDVARGYELFLNNCATCHGTNGEGGVGPPLNDQAKLYNALTATGLPGPGHLNPNYIKAVLTYGGRYVCGDPASKMPAWLEPNGPLNYRQVEELIAFLTASKETKFVHAPEHAAPGETLPPPEEKTGWRDPAYKPAADAPSPPACWRDPDGPQYGPNPSPGSGGSGGGGTVDKPGTPEAPRVIKLKETASLTITDEAGQKATAITVKKGETVRFEVENTAGFIHNLKVGPADQLPTAPQENDLPGTPVFSSGVQSFSWTVPGSGSYQFACTVIGHYSPMHGDFQIVD